MGDFSHALDKVHADWLEVLNFEEALGILSKFIGEYQPQGVDIFRVFETSPKNVRLVVVGQDPYPIRGDATGLAFSVNRSINLPRSLVNLFKELSNDMHQPMRSNGDLSDWQEQGVFLINRILTVPIGVTNGHRNLGWEQFTKQAIAHLGKIGKVALLMGKSAQSTSAYFERKIEVAHPSPLSAHRGFFESRPFSKVNELLDSPIKW